jgi:hypothetical protein
MSEFIFLYRNTAANSRQSMGTPQQMQESMQRWMSWLKDLGEKGHVKDPGQPLDQTGKVVSGKQRSVTDGPYVEKDLVGGYSVVLAKDLSHAVELSRGCPIFDAGGAVEVRPVMMMGA